MNINEVYLRIIETENDSDVVKLAEKGSYGNSDFNKCNA